MRDQLMNNHRRKNTIYSYKKCVNKFLPFAVNHLKLSSTHPALLHTIRTNLLHKDLCTDDILSRFLAFEVGQIMEKGNALKQNIKQVKGW